MNTERGAALVIGLVLLLILTLLAVTGMNTATTELVMAGNEQYRRAAAMAATAGIEEAIADIGAGTETMAGKDARARPALGLVKVAQAVNQYGSHFDHPGFTPIRNLH